LAACGNGTGNTDTSKSSAAGDTKEAKTIDNKDIKIGVSIWSSTDVLGSQCKRILDEAADALGVQIQYVDQGHVSEKVTSSVEQLVAAGCQGIIICNSSDTEMTSAIKTANDNKVYLSQFFRIIDKDKNADIYKLATDSPYYISRKKTDASEWLGMKNTVISSNITLASLASVILLSMGWYESLCISSR